METNLPSSYRLLLMPRSQCKWCWKHLWEEVNCAEKMPPGGDRNNQGEAWTCQRWLERASDGLELGSKTLPPPIPRGKEIIFIR